MRFWLQTFVLAGRENPPRFVEMFMLLLSLCLLVFLFLFWENSQQWPYLVLSLSYGIGASSSLLVREAFSRSPQPRLTQVGAIAASAILLLIAGLFLVIQDAL